MNAALANPNLALGTSQVGQSLAQALSNQGETSGLFSLTSNPTSAQIAAAQAQYGYGPVYDVVAEDGPSNPSPYMQNVAQYTSQASPYFVELDRYSRYVFSLYSATSAMTPIIALTFGVITPAQAVSWTTYLATLTTYSAESAAYQAWQAAGSVGASPTVPVSPTGSAPTFSAPTALVFSYLGGSVLSTLIQRANSAATLVNAQPQPAVTYSSAGSSSPNPTCVSFVLSDATNDWVNGMWTDTSGAQHAFNVPPTSGSPSADSNSVVATNGVLYAVANCQAWLASLSFS